jgi:micrococcal nuclease
VRGTAAATSVLHVSVASCRLPLVRTLQSFGIAPCIVAVTVLSLAVVAPVAQADSVVTTAMVLKVVDGDTVDIVDDVRGRLRIRLLGIDTPETKKPGYTVGCWGPEASQFATSTLLGERVAFTTDPGQGTYDRYGRTLAYLDKADGWDYSIEAARAGAAQSYVLPRQPIDSRRRHRRCRAGGKGSWPRPVGSAVFRKHGISTPLTAPQTYEIAIRQGDRTCD